MFKKQALVKKLKINGVYQWLTPKTAEGNRFIVMFIDRDGYLIKYTNISNRYNKGYVKISAEFMHANLLNLLCVHEPG